MAIFSRKQKAEREPGVIDRKDSDDTLTNETAFYKKPTGLRLFTVFIYLVAVVFLILVEIGTLNNHPVIRSTYFLKINVANVIPESVPNAALVNSIAQSIGLHDFYQVGLWNYCAGYNRQGITQCSPHQTAYWFNPVEIISGELLAGASIALPTDVISVLGIVQTASLWMFACFMVGVVLSFLCIFIAPLEFSKKPRWSHKAKRIFIRSLPILILRFAALLFTAAGAVIATVMFVIFRNTFRDAEDLNIQAELGVNMLAFEWVAVAMTLIGFLMSIGTCCGICCCTGKNRAIKKQQRMSQVPEK